MSELLTVKAAALALDRDTSRIYSWIRAGRIPTVEVEGKLCFTLSDLLAADRQIWLEQNALKDERAKLKHAAPLVDSAHTGA
jgi:hypothetical protein